MPPSAPPPHGSARDVAIVHDWLPTIAGGEKVVAEMVRAFPKSEIYTLFDFLTEEERRGLTGGRPVHVSALNRLPGVRRYYRYVAMHPRDRGLRRDPS